MPLRRGSGRTICRRCQARDGFVWGRPNVVARPLIVSIRQGQRKNARDAISRLLYDITRYFD
jgi:hypothetical protein